MDKLKILLPYVVSGLIALGAFFTGSVTGVGDAFDIALNKDKAIAECKALIEGEVE